MQPSAEEVMRHKQENPKRMNTGSITSKKNNIFKLNRMKLQTEPKTQILFFMFSHYLCTQDVEKSRNAN